jgi:GT2 family glycosyltransferase
VTDPQVAVVVVNHNGGELTLACLRSVLASDWDPARLDVVLVDNASRDDVVERVRRELTAVRVIESSKNTGFAGGCNLGLKASETADLVALVNNDATVDPAWLRPLVTTLQHDATIGAACPKILLADRFVELNITSPTSRHGRGDRRELGVRVSGARADGQDVSRRLQHVRGFWGREAPRGTEPVGEWTAGEAVVRVPVGTETPHAGELRVDAIRPLRVTVASGTERVEVDVDTNPSWQSVPLGGQPLSIVNNAGSELRDGTFGADRGYLEPDDGQFATAEDVFAWCGAGVLLARAYLDDVGLFDERLFLYDEDLELSWRGHERGWRYRFVPDSIVHHVHAATTGEGSHLKDHFDERNRLLVLTRHAPLRTAAGAFARSALVTLSYARRELLSPLLRGARPRGAIVGRRLGALLAAAWRAPGMLASRLHDRRHSRVHR